MMNVQEQREMVEKANRILREMKSFTWRDLETQGKFSKNEKLSFISDDMLIVGCDIGSETHYARAIDIRGRELSKMMLRDSKRPVTGRYSLRLQTIRNRSS